MVAKITKIYEKICDVCMYIACFFVVVALLLTFAQVVLRMVFSTSIQWAEEVARYAMIAAMCLGVCTTARLNALPRVDIIYAKLPPKVQYILNYFFCAVMMFISGTFCYYGLTVAIKRIPTTGITFKISMGVMYGLIPFCCLMLFLNALIKMLNNRIPTNKNERLF